VSSSPTIILAGPTVLSAVADDYDESNGETILTFFEAQDVAKKLTRGHR
jgi:hypothetical protein